MLLIQLLLVPNVLCSINKNEFISMLDDYDIQLALMKAMNSALDRKKQEELESFCKVQGERFSVLINNPKNKVVLEKIIVSGINIYKNNDKSYMTVIININERDINGLLDLISSNLIDEVNLHILISVLPKDIKDKEDKKMYTDFIKILKYFELSSLDKDKFVTQFSSSMKIFMNLYRCKNDENADLENISKVCNLEIENITKNSVLTALEKKLDSILGKKKIDIKEHDLNSLEHAFSILGEFIYVTPCTIIASKEKKFITVKYGVHKEKTPAEILESISSGGRNQGRTGDLYDVNIAL